MLEVIFWFTVFWLMKREYLSMLDTVSPRLARKLGYDGKPLLIDERYDS